MAKAVQFRRTVDRLFKRRVWWLRNFLGKPIPGAPPSFGRREREKAIKQLQELASDALARKLAKHEFSKSVDKKKSWHVKGRGHEEKKRLFKGWYEDHIPYRRCIYIFWKEKKCIYVGKTKGGAGRPSAHFEKHWFNGISRVDIYALRGKKSLPGLECLAIHRFQPKENKSKAQAAKWTKKCPLCKVHRDIKSELRSIFSLG